MALANKGVTVPDEWKHKPTLTNKNGDTVAMFYAVNGKTIPECWRHDPALNDNS